MKRTVIKCDKVIIEACLEFNGKTDEGAMSSLRGKRSVMKNYAPKVAVKPDLEGV